MKDIYPIRIDLYPIRTDLKVWFGSSLGRVRAPVASVQPSVYPAGPSRGVCVGHGSAGGHPGRGIDHPGRGGQNPGV